MKTPVYMDGHATTPVDPRVVEAMLPYLVERFGNPASVHHAWGRQAEEAVEAAREEVARLVGAAAGDLVFTSGATESNNLALLGIAEAAADPGRHLITCVTEHPSVLDVTARLQGSGWQVTTLPVDRLGRLDPDAVQRAITPATVMVSVMAANNEIGTLQPIADIGRITRKAGVLLHSDAAQAIGKIPVDVEMMGVDLLSISAHKYHGPKGVGALYIRGAGAGAGPAPILHGGGHERGYRPGTINVPGVVGLGAASSLARGEMTTEATRVARLRDRLQQGIFAGIRDVSLNGHPDERLPGSLNLSFQGVEGEALMLAMNDVAVSSGSACTSALQRPSHVLQALGLDREALHSSLRFGLGRFTTDAEVDQVVERVCEAVSRLRKMSPYSDARG